jgi:DNA-binding transcriptional LysR family regulator
MTPACSIPAIEDVAGLVAKTLGNSQRALVVSPAFLSQYGRPESPADLPKFNTVASTDDIFDGGARWNLTSLDHRTEHITLKPRVVTSDLRVRLQAAIRGIGIALLPEQVISAPALLGPVIFNILLFHITMAPAGLPAAIFVTFLWLIVAYRVRAAFAGLFQDGAEQPKSQHSAQGLPRLA